jgi:formyl-CoA transferase
MRESPNRDHKDVNNGTNKGLTTRSGPLSGLTVIELGHYIAAPFAGRLLADMGATVIKVEPPGGDPFRGWGEAVNGNSLWFSIHGRNKLCVTLDLKKPAGRDAVLALAARADALLENFRPGQLEKLGLSPSVLHQANPKLTIARISGYGQDGPYRDKPAFGAIGEAMGGIRHLTGHAKGESDLPPPRCGISLGDDLAGLYAAMGVLAACWARDAKAAKGRVLDVSLTESIVSLMEGLLPEFAILGRVRQPAGAAIPTAAPTNTYPTSDGGWIVIAGNSDPIFSRLSGLIGEPGWANDPRFATNAARCANVAVLDAAIAAWTRGRTATQAEALLQAEAVPACRLYTVADIAQDPHFTARGAVLAVDDPLTGRTLHPGPVPRFDGEPPEGVVAWTGAAVGAHNDAVLRDMLGLDESLVREITA